MNDTGYVHFIKRLYVVGLLFLKFLLFVHLIMFHSLVIELILVSTHSIIYRIWNGAQLAHRLMGLINYFSINIDFVFTFVFNFNVMF